MKLLRFGFIAFALAACTSVPKGSQVEKLGAQAERQGNTLQYVVASNATASEGASNAVAPDVDIPRPSGSHHPDVTRPELIPSAPGPKEMKVSRQNVIAIAQQGRKVKLGGGVFESATLTSNRELLAGTYGTWTVGGNADLQLDDPIWLVAFKGDFTDSDRHYRLLTSIIDANTGKPFGIRLDP